MIISAMLKVKRVEGNDLPLPDYKTEGAAGFDLASTQNIILLPGLICLVSTGLIFEVPEGFELQIRPRSGLAINHGLRLISCNKGRNK